jgi:hypothetical protein
LGDAVHLFYFRVPATLSIFSPIGKKKLAKLRSQTHRGDKIKGRPAFASRFASSFMAMTAQGRFPRTASWHFQAG